MRSLYLQVHISLPSNVAVLPWAQVIGWPPVRSFRKNTLATISKDNDEVDGKLNSGAFFVKVSMDGAPYLQKVGLRNYTRMFIESRKKLKIMKSSDAIGLGSAWEPAAIVTLGGLPWEIETLPGDFVDEPIPVECGEQLNLRRLVQLPSKKEASHNLLDFRRMIRG
ncbi:hypothetical protein SAY86_031558 [Trapa natans]|uniref:Auxin-responsive protein n=1 Tax=Trapa natans TaxID=22666 RepID=A0AAN7LRY1_TRANT|nr:hypothetical protein SAY86_031558 [Trapa natans]